MSYHCACFGLLFAAHVMAMHGLDATQNFYIGSLHSVQTSLIIAQAQGGPHQGLLKAGKRMLGMPGKERGVDEPKNGQTTWRRLPCTYQNLLKSRRLVLTNPYCFILHRTHEACLTRGSRWGLALSLFTNFFIDWILMCPRQSARHPYQTLSITFSTHCRRANARNPQS